MSEPIKGGQFPKSCSCGLLIGQSEWTVLDLLGYQDDSDHPEGARLELRNCGCGTTLALVIAQPAKFLLKATSLEELMDTILRLKDKDVQHLGEVQFPTFGGETPAILTNVWSWDETRLLVGAKMELLRIVQRNPA